MTADHLSFDMKLATQRRGSEFYTFLQPQRIRRKRPLDYEMCKTRYANTLRFRLIYVLENTIFKSIPDPVEGASATNQIASGAKGIQSR